MSATIKRTVSVTRSCVIAPIRMVYGDTLLTIQIELSDYTLSSSATATAYSSLTGSGVVYSNTATVSDNTISVTPVAGFFNVGKNDFQIKITDSGTLITFSIPVICDGDLSTQGSASATTVPTLVDVQASITAETSRATSAESSILAKERKLRSIYEANLSELNFKSSTEEVSVSDYVTQTENSRYGSSGKLISETDYLATKITNCEEGETYKLTGRNVGASSGYTVVFVDATGNVLSHKEDYTQEDGNITYVTIPNDCVEIRYSQFFGTGYTKYNDQKLLKTVFSDTRFKSCGTVGQHSDVNDARPETDIAVVPYNGLDYIFCFHSSSDDNQLDENGVLWIKAYGNGYANSATFEYIAFHTFGHVNTIDYDSKNDCFILGNGSGDKTLAGKFHIIQNVTDRFIVNPPDAENVTFGEHEYKRRVFRITDSNVISYDCSSYGFGIKLNMMWGESNGDSDNIAYMVTDNHQHIRKILLGTGTNSLAYGSYTAPGTDAGWNGTFAVLNLYTLSGCTDSTVINGGTYRNGYLYTCVGGSFRIWQISLDDDGGAYINYKSQKLINGTGSQIDFTDNGLAFDSSGNLLVVGSSSTFSPYKPLYCFKNWN